MQKIRTPFWRRLIGSRQFYKAVLAITLPIMLQNGITNFVGLLDNIMVGRVGTNQMTGVAISNQLFLVINLCFYGATAGAGIFTAQYYGAGEMEALRHTVRYKVIVTAIIAALGISICLLFGQPLIKLFLGGQASECDPAVVLDHAWKYMKIMLIGYVPFGIATIYAGTLRETGKTVFPMVASIVAVFVNLVFNYLLIFGKFGFPQLGVEGAAVATVISRFVEAAIVVIGTHANKKNTFVVGLYKSLKVPVALAKDITKKGMPLLLNECMWSLGVTIISQCYSVRGVDVVAGMNIANTVHNFFFMIAMSLGNAIAIMVGHQLGAGRFDEAKDTVLKLTAFSVLSCIFGGIIMALLATPFANIYNTSDSIKELAVKIMWIYSACLPIIGFVNSTYFTLRSGGKTGITFAFDCGYTWLILVPIAFCVTRFTSANIILIFGLCQASEVVKAVAGCVLLKMGVWINKLN